MIEYSKLDTMEIMPCAGCTTCYEALVRTDAAGRAQVRSAGMMENVSGRSGKTKGLEEDT